MNDTLGYTGEVGVQRWIHASLRIEKRNNTEI